MTWEEALRPAPGTEVAQHCEPTAPPQDAVAFDGLNSKSRLTGSDTSHCHGFHPVTSSLCSSVSPSGEMTSAVWSHWDFWFVLLG